MKHDKDFRFWKVFKNHFLHTGTVVEISQVDIFVVPRLKAPVSPQFNKRRMVRPSHRIERVHEVHAGMPAATLAYTQPNGLNTSKTRWYYRMRRE